MTGDASQFVRGLIGRAAAPYRCAGRFAWHFARGKLAGDPVFAELLSRGLLTGRARILDIGCGQGLLASWLVAAHESGRQGLWPADWPAAPAPSHVRGIELMPSEVRRAQQALAAVVAKGRASFVACDMRSADFGQADAVVILDVLHYVEFAAQDDILRRVRDALSPGGVLLLRIGDGAGGLRFRFSLWVDLVVATLRGCRIKRLHCRPLAEWQRLLSSLGFEVRSQPMSAGTPFANVLLVAHLC